MDPNMTISVVVPVYNAEATLAETLEALAEQSFPSYEVIVVDDGSTDGSPGILDRFCREDPRFRAIRVPNGGPYRARRAGIGAARGRYIAFCDSDDLYLPDTLEKLCAQAEHTGADITAGGYIREEAGTGRVLAREMLAFEARGYDRPELWDVLPMVNSSVWNKLYRAELLAHVLPLEEPPRVGEDALFNASLCPFLRRIAFVPEPLYRYRVRPGSAIARVSADDSEDFRKCLLQTRDHVLRLDDSRETRAYLDSLALLQVGLAMTVHRMYSGERIAPAAASARQWLNRHFPGCKRAGRSFLWNLQHGNAQLRLLLARWIFQARLMAPALLVYRVITRTGKTEIKW